METLEKTKVTDYEKIKNINNEDKESFIHWFAEYSLEIEKALYHNNKSISDWFQVFVLSPEFERLEREEKKECFKQHNALKHLLQIIDEFCSNNEIGEYNHNH